MADEEKVKVPLKHFPNAQVEFTKDMPLIGSDNATLDDIAASEDPEKTIVSGFFRLKKGEPLVYAYGYHEMKIILEGEFIISDECGNKVTAKPGDTFYFSKGTVITFDTPSYGLAFFTGQRKLGEG